MFEAAGYGALSEMVTAFQGQYPGHTFRRGSAVDLHHDRVRFLWELLGPDGGMAAGGIDFGVVEEDGRLSSITGFLGEPPKEAAA